MQIVNILDQEGIQLKNDIRANMGAAGQNATNETAQSLRIEITQEGTKYKFKLFGRPFFMTVQTGRKPTPGKKPSREMINRITAWTEARNMEPEAVWAIATNIQNKGTKLWREGGRKDIVDPAVNDFIESIKNKLIEEGANNLVTKMKELKW